jgi:FixJ family two-component response regulator
MNSTTPTVYVVDDDASMQSSLTRLLEAAGYEVHVHSSPDEFLLARPWKIPGCVLLDVCMPGSSGLDLQNKLGADTLPIIFLTAYGDIPMSVHAMKAGAVDFLTKPVQHESLLAAIQTALAREAHERRSREQSGLWRSLYEDLSLRERAVFAHLVAGQPNKSIAAQLDISERTVKAHRAQVLEKMRVTSVAELVRIAERLAISTSLP